MLEFMRNHRRNPRGCRTCSGYVEDMWMCPKCETTQENTGYAGKWESPLPCRTCGGRSIKIEECTECNEQTKVDSRRNPMPHGKSFMEWAKEEDKAHPDESFINWASDEAHEYKQQVKYGTEKARDYAASRPREAEKKAKAAVRGFEQWISSEIDEAAHTRRNPAHTFASFCSEAKKGTAQRKKLAKKHNAPLSIVEEINKYANKLGGSDDVNVAQELFEGWCI